MSTDTFKKDLDARDVYNGLKRCHHVHNLKTVYKGWQFSWRFVYGFYGHVNSNLGKERKMELIQKHIDTLGLPLKMQEDLPHLTRILFTITK